MDLHLLARVATACFGLVTLIGVAWFSNSLGPVLITSGLLMGLCSLTVAFLARSEASRELQRIVFFLCLVGIAAGLVLIANDIRRSFEDEWPAVLMRLVHITALAVIAIEASGRSLRSN